MISAINTIFNKLASDTSGNLQRHEKKYPVGDGSYLPLVQYILTYRTRETSVLLKNKFGHQNLGHIALQLDAPLNDLQFTIKTRSIYKQFWNRKKSPFEVNSNHAGLIKWIKENEAFKKLADRARIDRFEPTIQGKMALDHFEIICDYHLVFNNNELVLEPFVLFFNGLNEYLLDLKVIDG